MVMTFPESAINIIRDPKSRPDSQTKSQESQISYFQFQFPAIVNANVSTWALSGQLSFPSPIPWHPCHFRSVRTMRKISGMSTP